MFEHMKKYRFSFVVLAMFSAALWLGAGSVEAAKKAKKKPLISVNFTSMTFEGVLGETPTPETLTISNLGKGLKKNKKLLWKVTTDVPWLSVSPTSGKARTGKRAKQTTVSVNIAGLGKGAHTGNITVSGTNRKGKKAIPVTIPVQLILDYADQRASIHGNVIDNATGDPVSGATATLTYDEDGDGEAETIDVTTGASGEFVFLNVPVQGGVNSAGGTITVVPGAGAYNVTVSADGYGTVYPSVALNYEVLISDGWITTLTLGDGTEVVSGLVDNLSFDAGITFMSKLGAIMQGVVVNGITGDPISGATITAHQDAGPPTGSAIDSVVTAADGTFSFGNLKEFNRYTLVIDATGFAVMPGNEIDDLDTGPSGTTFLVDADGGDNDGNPMTPITLHSTGVVIVDVVPPYIVASSVAPGASIPPESLGGDFTFTFSEPMDTATGTLVINTTSFKSIRPSTMAWSVGDTLLTLTPTDPLPEGFEFTIFGFTTLRDKTGNAYTGEQPLEINADSGDTLNDIFLTQICGGNTQTDCTTLGITDSTSDSNSVVDPDDASAQGFLTYAANATVPAEPLVATNLTQTAPTVDPVTGFAASMSGQANNMNHIDPFGTLGGGNRLGDDEGEANAINLSWTAPTAGSARAYNQYAELNTGGFENGLPVLVSKGIKSGAPPTSTGSSPMVLGPIDAIGGAPSGNNIENAIGDFNAGPSDDPDVTGDEPDPISTVASLNTSATTSRGAGDWQTDHFPGGSAEATVEGPGTSLFFDNAFKINTAVTVIDGNGNEGDFSAPIEVGDNVPPAISGQQDYTDGDPEGFSWTALSASNTVRRPQFAITDEGDDLDGGPPGGNLNMSTTLDTSDAGLSLTSLVGLTGTTENPVGNYDAADFTAWTALTSSFIVTSNEDLDKTATPTVAVNDSTGAAKAGVLASVALTNAIGGETGPTTSDSNRELKVTMTNADLLGLVSGDRLAFSLTDEAANTASSDLDILDETGPFLISAMTTRTGIGANAVDQLIATFDQGVTKASAEVIGNYGSSGSLSFGGDTASLAADGVTVTINADGTGYSVTGEGQVPSADGWTTPGTAGQFGDMAAISGTEFPAMDAASVLDLDTVDGGNNIEIFFIVNDGIKPRVLGAVDFVAIAAVNSGVQVAGDNIWRVGDTGTSELFNIRVSFNENIFKTSETASPVNVTSITTRPTVSGVLSPVGTYPLTPSVLTVLNTEDQADIFFSFNTAAAVAAGDTLTLTVTDTSGNASTITIKLAASNLDGFTGEN